MGEYLRERERDFRSNKNELINKLELTISHQKNAHHLLTRAIKKETSEMGVQG